MFISYVCYQGRIDPMCFSGSGPTHFLRWIVYYCVCIQHDVDKSQIAFIELRKTLRTNSGWYGNQDMYWIVTTYKACFSKHCFVTAEFKIFISPADCGVWTHPHLFTDLRPCFVSSPRPPAAIAFSAYVRPQNASGSKKNTGTSLLPKSGGDKLPSSHTKLRLWAWVFFLKTVISLISYDVCYNRSRSRSGPTRKTSHNKQAYIIRLRACGLLL